MSHARQINVTQLSKYIDDIDRLANRINSIYHPKTEDEFNKAFDRYLGDSKQYPSATDDVNLKEKTFIAFNQKVRVLEKTEIEKIPIKDKPVKIDGSYRKVYYSSIKGRIVGSYQEKVSIRYKTGVKEVTRHRDAKTGRFAKLI